MKIYIVTAERWDSSTEFVSAFKTEASADAKALSLTKGWCDELDYEFWPDEGWEANLDGINLALEDEDIGQCRLEVTEVELGE